MTSGKRPRSQQSQCVLTRIKPDDESRKRVCDYESEVESSTDIFRANSGRMGQLRVFRAVPRPSRYGSRLVSQPFYKQASALNRHLRITGPQIARSLSPCAHSNASINASGKQRRQHIRHKVHQKVSEHIGHKIPAPLIKGGENSAENKRDQCVSRAPSPMCRAKNC